MSDMTKGAMPTSPAIDGDDRHSLQTYVSDMLALVQHIEAPIERQLKMDKLSEYGDARAILTEIQTITAAHETALQDRLTALGGHAGAGLKSAWAALLGAGAATVDSMRKTKISKSLRDDYTALSLASVSYTMLNATALGLGDAATASLAQRHLSDITPVIIRISRAIPAVVLQELQDDGEHVQTSAAAIAAGNVAQAWSQPSESSRS